ncbi:MAG: 23S rRNA (pseudouridine(1915)-N(3))-methyltransferase RlmH [Saprospiraceae bacterium]|nr:23S rRNA (pseudouridine(1915)-N(3))-methyltransferase RlmH [Saprospiraceae bacterium]
MKIEVWWIGKTTAKAFLPIVADYEKRLGRFHSITIREFPSAKDKNPNQQKIKEGNQLLKHIDKSDHIVLLDERGSMHSSQEFANYINKKAISISHKLIFIVGGPYGFSQKLYTRANELHALSLMTFTHEMVRLFFLEQLYRAFTIIHHHPYHNS